MQEWESREKGKHTGKANKVEGEPSLLTPLAAAGGIQLQYGHKTNFVKEMLKYSWPLK